jgi:hypothetical protein
MRDALVSGTPYVRAEVALSLPARLKRAKWVARKYTISIHPS